MPIASFKPDEPGPLELNLPQIEPTAYQSILQDDSSVPLSSLISYMEGAPWNVNYYSQVVTQHTDLREHDIGQENAYQQYTKTNALEIRVTTPLDSSTGDGNNIVLISGNALMHPFLIPNFGDMFVGSVGDNQDAIFTITKVQRKNFNRDSVYSVDYKAVGYVDADPLRYANLESKVTKTYQFHRDRLAEGLFPSVSESESRHIVDLKTEYQKIVMYYAKTFFNRKYGTLVLPGQAASIYDSYVVDYVLKTTDTFDAYELRFVKNLNTEGDHYLSQPQFWQALLEKDISVLQHCQRKMGLVLTKSFFRDPVLKGIRYSTIDYLVYPNGVDTTLDSPGQMPPPAIGFLEQMEVPSGPSLMRDLLHNTVVLQNATIPLISPVLESPYYVFSEGFYNDKTTSSILEGLAMDYIKGKSLNIELLHKLTESYKRWGRLEQFYYLPILMTLIKNSVGIYY